MTSIPPAMRDVDEAFRQAVALHQTGRIPEAERAYRQVLSLQPRHFDALHMLGILHAQAGDGEGAVFLIGEALKIHSAAPVLVNYANALQSVGRYGDALANYDRAIALDPGAASAFYNRGTLLQALKRPREALASLTQALALKPDHAEAYLNRGTVYQSVNRLEEALKDYEQAVALKPDYAEAHNNRGNVLFFLRRLEEARLAYDRALAFKPGLVEAVNWGFQVTAQLAYWQDYRARAADIVQRVRVGQPIGPFILLWAADDPELHMKAAANYAAFNYPARAPVMPVHRAPHTRIRVAYVSGDFYAHATAYLMAELFELHDREKFEFYAISLSRSDESPMRARLEASFEHFVEAWDKTDEDIARLIASLEIDIAVDLKGYTKDARAGVFAYRPAPIAVSYLGYPGTLGASYMDYVVADPHVVTPENRPFFTEKVVMLPDSYQVNDSKRWIAERVPSRVEQGLPENAFVFCCFNSTHKITPDMFALWMRLLNEIEGSVLWLYVETDTVMENIRRAAKERGVNSERVVFAKLQPHAEHLARARLADLFLDTLPYNAHTTASEALWAGLPVLTCMGRSFAARVAGSLLQAARLPELITHTLADYEALALALARDPVRLKALREKLAKNRADCALFDAGRFRRHIESAYEVMWARHRKGLPAADFAVEPQP